MTVPNTASLYPAVFTVSAVDTVFEQMRGYEITPEMNFTEVVAVGTVDRVAVIESHSDPMFRLETNDLSTLFAFIDLVDGNCVDSATFQAQHRKHCGVFDPAAVHSLFQSPGGGHLHLERFSWRQDDVEGATASCIFVPHYDGINFPITIAQDQALDGVAQFNTIFYGGKMVCTVGTALQTYGLMGIEVDVQLEYRRMRSDGDVYARTGSIVRRMPIIRATFIGTDAWKTDPNGTGRRPGLFFNSLSGAGPIDFYLYQGKHGGRRFPLTDPAHIRLRIDDASQWNIARIGGRDHENVETTWEIRPVENNWSLSIGQVVA